MAYVKKIRGTQRVIDAMHSLDISELFDALVADATRQAYEMERWKKVQEDYDPEGNALLYEDDLFPLVVKAVRYRHRIYKATSGIKKIKVEIYRLSREAAKNGMDAPDLSELNTEWRELEDQLFRLMWNIRKIYYVVVKQVQLNSADGTDGEEFEEFEYDPEKYA